MKTDDDDRSALDDVPFVRTGPSSELWPRIAAAARATQRGRLARTWTVRLGSLAAGLLVWLAANALLRNAAMPADPRAPLVRDERAWLRGSSDELPPEAQLVTSLVARGGQR